MEVFPPRKKVSARRLSGRGERAHLRVLTPLNLTRCRQPPGTALQEKLFDAPPRLGVLWMLVDFLVPPCRQHGRPVPRFSPVSRSIQRWTWSMATAGRGRVARFMMGQRHRRGRPGGAVPGADAAPPRPRGGGRPESRGLTPLLFRGTFRTACAIFRARQSAPCRTHAGNRGGSMASSLLPLPRHGRSGERALRRMKPSRSPAAYPLRKYPIPSPS